MTDRMEAIRAHYGERDLAARILAAAAAAGLDVEALTAADLAPFDQFHIRGREATRELARLAVHEACAGSVAPPYFPLPWASDAALNLVVAPDALRRMLVRAGFMERIWRDVTVESLEWFRKARAIRAARTGGAAEEGRPGLHILMGRRAGEKVANLVRSLVEDRVRVVMAVLERTTGGPSPFSAP